MTIRYLFVVVFFLSVLAVPAQTVTPEIFAPGVISGPVHEAAPTFSPDGKTVWFFRNGPAFSAVIMVSHLLQGGWSKPDIASFSGVWQDIEPVLAPDGSYLIFSSNRPISPGGQPLNGMWNRQRFAEHGGNLWRVDCKGTSWGEPYRLPEQINSDSSVFSPAVTADGSLYFMKPVGDTGKFHIYRAPYHNGQYGQPVAMPFSAVDTIGDFDPAVTADDSWLIFCSRRPPATTTELYIVFQKNGSWSAPISLGKEVNRVSNTEPRLSPDHRRVYFSNSYTPMPAPPGDRVGKQQALDRSEWETGSLNIWSVPLDNWIGH